MNDFMQPTNAEVIKRIDEMERRIMEYLRSVFGNEDDDEGFDPKDFYPFI